MTVPVWFMQYWEFLPFYFLLLGSAEGSSPGPCWSANQLLISVLPLEWVLVYFLVGEISLYVYISSSFLVSLLFWFLPSNLSPSIFNFFAGFRFLSMIQWRRFVRKTLCTKYFFVPFFFVVFLCYTSLFLTSLETSLVVLLPLGF